MATWLGAWRRLTVGLLLAVGAVLPCAVGQTGAVNQSDFDRRLIHYGVQVGYTQSKFDLRFNEDEVMRRTLLGVTSYYEKGFHIAIIGELRLSRWFSLRTVPGVTLVSRNIAYTWEPNYLATNHILEQQRTVESVYGDIPLEVLYRAVRYGNFRPYVMSGISYGFDIASLRKNRNRTNQSIVRLSPHDLRYTMGVGFDVFLRYVKFAIEAKMSFGMLDIKVDDPDVYISSFDYLRTRTFMLSFTFEG